MYQLNDVRVQTILDIPALTIHDHAVTCITGESGSGKTTFLRLLNRLITPDTGSILYHSRLLSSYDPVLLRRQVVMMSQEPLIFPGTLGDNLQMGLHFSEKPAASDHDLKEMLAFVKLEKSLTADPLKLSGGEKQRLALGRILLMSPAVLLLDEPSASLDDETEEFVIQRVVEYVRRNGSALVMVTHSKRLAQSIGGHHITFANGSIAVNTGGDLHE